MDDLPCEAGENLIEMATGKDARSICDRKVPTWMKGRANECEPFEVTGRECVGAPKIVESDIEL